MKEFLKKVPTPICGAMLGVLGLGNLIADYSTSMHDLCCIIGLVLLAIILLKLFFHPKVIINELKTPTIASVSGTFAMSLIILSSYIAPSSRSIGCCLWIFSVLLFTEFGKCLCMLLHCLYRNSDCKCYSSFIQSEHHRENHSLLWSIEFRIPAATYNVQIFETGYT